MVPVHANFPSERSVMQQRQKMDEGIEESMATRTATTMTLTANSYKPKTDNQPVARGDDSDKKTHQHGAGSTACRTAE